MIKSDPTLDQMTHPDLPYRLIEILWAVRYEMARGVEDVLARRTRALILNARASIEATPKVAKILAEELLKDKIWEQNQINNYLRLAQNYIP